MGNCLRKLRKPSSYDQLAGAQIDTNKSNVNDDQETTHEQTSHKPSSIHETSTSQSTSIDHPDTTGHHSKSDKYDTTGHHSKSDKYDTTGHLSKTDHHGNKDQHSNTGHHSAKEEEVTIRIGQSTHVHSKVIQDDLLGVAEYPFLSEKDTIDFISQSHTMFIMRGVPGSGKSTLAKRIQKQYPEAVKCSADDFFIDADGIYRYDQSKISKAHQACQEKAKGSCENRVPVIIIDNTNTHRWEMSPYVKLAQFEHFYHIIPVQPNTPWRYNAQELQHRTTHGVHEEKIQQMLDNLKSQQFLPLYYGWFLTQKDSSNLFELGIKCLMEGVVAMGENLAEDINAIDILNSLGKNFVKPHLILHCTAKYIASNPKHEYHNMEIVKKALHRTFKLKVVGFSYTERNIGAKLELDSDELKLFESEVESEDNDTDKDSRYHANSTVDFSKSFNIQHGCTAHITLTYAHDSSARITGKDMLDIWRIKQMENDPKQCSSSSLGNFEALGDGYFYFELKSPVVYTTLFHGFYPKR